MNSRGEPEGPGRVGLGRRDAQEPEPPATDAGLRYWSTRCATVTVRNHCGILDLSRGTHRRQAERDWDGRLLATGRSEANCLPLVQSRLLPAACRRHDRERSLGGGGRFPLRLCRAQESTSDGRLAQADEGGREAIAAPASKTGGARTYDFLLRSCRLTVIINFR